jgi:hypothetical protein
MDIQCFACTPPTSWATEDEYKDHLIMVHGTSSPDEAIKIERQKRANSPANLPGGIPLQDAPTPEFIKTLTEIEKGRRVSQATPPPLVSVPKPKIEPIILKYKYEGQHSCGNKVNTLELDANGKHFVVAYCLFCQTQVEIREVVDLNKKKNDNVLVTEPIKKEDKIKEISQETIVTKEKKKGKKNG